LYLYAIFSEYFIFTETMLNNYNSTMIIMKNFSFTTLAALACAAIFAVGCGDKDPELPAPEVKITSTLALGTVHEIKYSEAVDKPKQNIALEIAATRGLGSLKVKITTDSELINGALVGMGLTGQFDLATLPAEQAGALNTIFGGGLTIGDAVKGKEKVTLNLSAIPVFIAGAIQGGVAQFDVAIEATDAAKTPYTEALITKSATLRLKFTDDVNAVPNAK